MVAPLTWHLGFTIAPLTWHLGFTVAHVYLTSRVCCHIICLAFYVFDVVDSIYVGSLPYAICLGFVAILYEHIVMSLIPFKLSYDLVVVL